MSDKQDNNVTDSSQPDKNQELAKDNKTAAGDTGQATASANKPKSESRHSATQHRHKRHTSRRKSSSWGIVLLILIAAIAAAGWYGYTEVTRTKEVFTDIRQSQADLKEQNREFEENLMTRMEKLQTQQKELTDYIQVLRDKNKHLRKDWLLMEAEYLIQLANYRLLFERDINTAVSALQSADVRLRETGDPGILVVRKVIAEAVQELKQVPQADLAGLSLTLTAINNEVDKLPLATPDPASKKYEEEQAKTEQQTKKVGSWSELPSAIWSDLKSLIVFRDHEAPIQPLLSPDERFFLTENLRLQIEQARLAMLIGQASVYEERLTTAIGWIEKYFDKESSITKSTLDTLKQIRAQSIAPKLPDISNTYQALHNYRLGIVTSIKSKSDSTPAQAEPEEKEQATPAPATGAK